MLMRLACSALLCFLALPAGASDIRAVVNTDIISAWDVTARTALALVSAKIPDTPQARQTLDAQVLRGLIDERLQLQEAERQKIKVTTAEVTRAIQALEQQNQMQPGDLKTLLQRERVPSETLEQQIRASIGWSKLVQGRFARRAGISDSEVDAVLARLAASQGKSEYRIGEILIPPTASGQTETSRPTTAATATAEAAARRIFEQIMKGGGSFSALARQFSASPTAAVGGDMGWIIAEDLEAPFNRLVTRMQPGQISAPLQTPDGFRIITLIDRRVVGIKGLGEARATLHQLVFPSAGQETPGKAANSAGVREADRAVYNRATAATGRIASCTDAEAIARDENLPLSGALGDLRLTDMPPVVQQAVLQTAVNKATQPLKVGTAWVVMTVCAKTLPTASQPDREAVREQLRTRKLERLSQQYLRDVRQGAYIDLR
jgi:peptidyl-prolyl cis-trans isomerase SurA